MNFLRASCLDVEREYIVKIIDSGLHSFLFSFFYLIFFSFIFYFLFLEQLRLGVISHAVTSVTT